MQATTTAGIAEPINRRADRELHRADMPLPPRSDTAAPVATFVVDTAADAAKDVAAVAAVTVADRGARISDGNALRPSDNMSASRSIPGGFVYLQEQKPPPSQ